MIKTLQEFNRDFAHEMKFGKKVTEPIMFPETSGDIIDMLQARIAAHLPKRLKKKISEQFAAQSYQPQRLSPTINKPLWKDFSLLAIKFAVIALSLMLLFSLVFGIERYEEPSMSPSIKHGDLVIFHRYTKVGYLPQDTIVLEYNGLVQVRRVVATAGDVVDITEEGLLINDALQQEADIHQKTERYADGISFPLTVPDGHIFVLSDSRQDATDSRVYGSVNIDDTLGKVIAVIRQRNV